MKKEKLFLTFGILFSISLILLFSSYVSADELTRCNFTTDGGEFVKAFSVGEWIVDNREGVLYCSGEEIFKRVLDDGESCSKGYECLSKRCAKGICSSPNFFSKISSWFKKTFTGHVILSPNSSGGRLSARLNVSGLTNLSSNISQNNPSTNGDAQKKQLISSNSSNQTSNNLPVNNTTLKSSYAQIQNNNANTGVNISATNNSTNRINAPHSSTSGNLNQNQISNQVNKGTKNNYVSNQTSIKTTNATAVAKSPNVITRTFNKIKSIFGIKVKDDSISNVLGVEEEFNLEAESNHFYSNIIQFGPEGVPLRNQPRVPMTNEYHLEVLFFNVTTCYIAKSCDPSLVSQGCVPLIDYSDQRPLFYYRTGTLESVKSSEADYVLSRRGYDLKKCTSSEFTPEEIIKLKGYVQEMSHLIFNWTNQNMLIKPRYRFIDADMSSGKLRTIMPEGYETNKYPPLSQFESSAIVAGADLENADMIVIYVDPFPEKNSENPGLKVQAYVGSVYGQIKGIPPALLASYPDNRGHMISATIHELLHVINIGHYSISQIPDVYGIENSESRGWTEGQPRPHCTLTEHYTQGSPNPYSYFPDSYNWLDPMWNSKPLEPYPESGALSYCLGSYVYPSVNPLNSDDTYEDIAGMGENIKYYKFVFQNHYSPEYVGKLYTNAYKAGWKKYPL